MCRQYFIGRSARRFLCRVLGVLGAWMFQFFVSSKGNKERFLFEFFSADTFTWALLSIHKSFVRRFRQFQLNDNRWHRVYSLHKRLGTCRLFKRGRKVCGCGPKNTGQFYPWNPNLIIPILLKTEVTLWKFIQNFLPNFGVKAHLKLKFFDRQYTVKDQGRNLEAAKYINWRWNSNQLERCSMWIHCILIGIDAC